MAAIWKGAINFGLINIPVKLFAAVDKKTVAFRSLHKKCLTPISQKRWCGNCESEVDYKDLVKGYEYEKGSFVTITDEELKSVTVKSSKYIQIIDFIKLEEVDPIFFDKAYFLSPETSGEKPYLILYNSMKETKTVAVSKITIREREALCMVRVYEDILMLNTMYFGSEIRSTAEVNMEKMQKKVEVSKIEMQMAKDIVGNLTASFDADKYSDQYYEQLQKLVNAKVDGKEIVRPGETKGEKDNRSLDLFEKLKASLEATKRSKQFKEESVDTAIDFVTKKSQTKKEKIVLPKTAKSGTRRGVST